VASDLGYLCGSCQEWHDELPLSYGAPFPEYWTDELAADGASGLSEDQFVIKGEQFFAHGLIEIPVAGTGEVFSWGVWVSLSQANYDRMSEVWETEGRESEPPYFGWLSTQLPYSPETLNLKTLVHTRAVGERPVVELEPTDHPLALEQRNGITLDRVRELAGLMLHG
jgi:hypothetical protein